MSKVKKCNYCGNTFGVVFECQQGGKGNGICTNCCGCENW